MAKKAINLEHLQKLAERGHQRAQKREQKKRLSEDQRSDAEAKKLSDDIIADLLDRFETEARRGNRSLHVNLPRGFLHDKVKNNISNWAWNNDLTVTTKDVRYSDDSGLEEIIVISLPNKK